MVAEIGSMFVKVEVDETQTKTALRNTDQGLKDMSRSTKLAFGDLAVMGVVAGATAGAVSSFVSSAISGFTDLILKSPIVADLFQRMDNAAQRASLTLGESFRPSLTLVTEGVEEFSDSLENNQGIFDSLNDVVVGFLIGLGDMKDLLTDIAKLAKIDIVIGGSLDILKNFFKDLGVDAEDAGGGIASLLTFFGIGTLGGLLKKPNTGILDIPVSKAGRLKGALKRGGQFAIGAFGAQQFLEGTLAPAGTADTKQAPFGAALATFAATKNPLLAGGAFIASSLIETLKNFEAGNLGFQQGDEADSLAGGGITGNIASGGISPSGIETMMRVNEQEDATKAHYTWVE